MSRVTATLIAAITFAGPAAAQNPGCLCANPSFELGSPFTELFEGWNHFGNVNFTTEAPHNGGRAATISGPNTGNWSVSGIWQELEAAPGDVFTASVHAAHRSDNPLTGQARGLLNIEWRNAAGDLISFESYDAVTATSPTDRYLPTTITTPPAPAGTTAARILLGTLQSPAQETGAVVFDTADFIRNKPAYDAAQWNDFPGGRTLDFGNQTWRVKGPGFYGPGPNVFSDSPADVWVDQQGLHMTISSAGGWSSTEIVTENPLGYGDYIFTTKGNLDLFADNTVLGLFLWQYPPCYEPDNRWNQHNEIDVEISRWGNPNNDNAQFVTQPYNWPGNIDRFDIDYTTAKGDTVTYAIRWLPGRTESRAWFGNPDDESPANMIHAWNYAGAHNPTPEQPRVHINLWHTDNSPVNNQDQHALITDFVFIPLADTTADGTHDFFDVLEHIDRAAAGNSAADLDNDGAHTPNDLFLLLENF